MQACYLDMTVVLAQVWERTEQLMPFKARRFTLVLAVS